MIPVAEFVKIQQATEKLSETLQLAHQRLRSAKADVERAEKALRGALVDANARLVEANAELFLSDGGTLMIRALGASNGR